MLEKGHFKTDSDKVTSWIQSYFDRLSTFPVKSAARPGEIMNKLKRSDMSLPVTLEELLEEFDKHILPGMTHWQHPNFHAYFPANSSIESLLAEFITAAMGAQCMIWETSPAAAEMEEFILNYLKPHLGIPGDWEGVIQDTASTATLAAIITAREVATSFKSNWDGVPGNLRVYASSETHSSIEKAVGIAGIGRSNFLKIGVDESGAMDVEQLRLAIESDKKNGLQPCCVVATVGTTGTVAVDSVRDIGLICQKHGIWLHVDAAFAGTALLLDDYKWMISGIDMADSFVFNPHKWMFTNFDCSVYYVKSSEQLISTFDILPEYLRTASRGQVKDYRDWGIPLGRRFRALKLWFVLRIMGIDNIKKKLEAHIALAEGLAERISRIPGLEITTDPFLNFFSFAVKPDVVGGMENANRMTEMLKDQLNDSSLVFLSHTKLGDRYILRMVVGQTYITKATVERTFDAISDTWHNILSHR